MYFHHLNEEKCLTFFMEKRRYSRKLLQNVIRGKFASVLFFYFIFIFLLYLKGKDEVLFLKNSIFVLPLPRPLPLFRPWNGHHFLLFLCLYLFMIEIRWNREQSRRFLFSYAVYHFIVVWIWIDKWARFLIVGQKVDFFLKGVLAG